MGSAGLVLEGGGLTVVDALVVVAVVVFTVVEDDLLVLDEAEVDVLEDTVVEEDEPPEPDLGNVDPMSPQRTLLWKSTC